MGRLDDITLEKLYELKDQIDEGKPRERVLAAIGRKQGDQLDTLAARHSVVERTIQNWLNRFEEEPIEQAAYNAPRLGGPAKIDGEEREQLFEQLQQPPTELGYDQQAWSAKLLLYYVKEEYGVEYHETYAYDLLKEAGLSCRTAWPRHREADPEDKAEFEEAVEKTAGTGQKNRGCRRSIHQTRRDRPAAWLAPDWLEPDDRDRDFLEVGDSAHRAALGATLFM